ncbi:hypothetical protein EC991_006462 [Linnemannia zychae]|nr:hypothetical protein EC991_006462 [Linnemannia zychae]
MAPNIRRDMETSIRALIDSSSTDIIQGKLYIIYERLSDFRWLPGNGDGESGSAFKHWKLLIVIGFDSFTLEFMENSLISRQGLVMVSPFDLSTSRATAYYLADITIDTETLYKRIQAFFGGWTVYNTPTHQYNQRQGPQNGGAISGEPRYHTELEPLGEDSKKTGSPAELSDTRSGSKNLTAVWMDAVSAVRTRCIIHSSARPNTTNGNLSLSSTPPKHCGQTLT